MTLAITIFVYRVRLTFTSLRSSTPRNCEYVFANWCVPRASGLASRIWNLRSPFLGGGYTRPGIEWGGFMSVQESGGGGKVARTEIGRVAAVVGRGGRGPVPIQAKPNYTMHPTVRAGGREQNVEQKDSQRDLLLYRSTSRQLHM